MKKPHFALTVIMALLYMLSFSQKPHPTANTKAPSKSAVKQRQAAPLKQSPITDTLAYNILTTLNELNAYIRDVSQPIQLMLGSFLKTNTWGNSFSSVIKVPTSIENTFIRGRVNRYKGVEQWEWKSILIRSPKNQLPSETFILLKSKIDSIIKVMPLVKELDEKNKVSNISVYENVSNAQYRYLYEVDEVVLQVDFVKPITQTEQQSLDSLVKLYRPGLSNVSTAKEASYKFTSALSAEGFSDEKREMIFADELKIVADKDINAAFKMLIDASYLRSKNLEAKLTDDQKSQIRKIATEVVNAYNAKWDPPPPTFVPAWTDPGSQQQVQQRQGKTVKCSLCNGVGQYEKVMRSHTYNGINGQVTTTFTKWAVCDVCNGTGWVIKYKKK